MFISYPTPAENITSAYSSSKLYVKLSFAGTCNPVDENTVRIKLPADITYVQGSVSLISAGTLNIIEQDVSDLRTPVFQFTGSGTEIIFSINRKASCVTETTFKDSVEVLGSSCTNVDFDISKNNYNVTAASLTLTAPIPVVNATIGMTTTRSIKITNGGYGAIDTIYFYVVYPTGAIENTNSDKITIAGTDFSPYVVSGDTIFYKIFGNTIFGGDNKLDPNENFNITEPIKINKCTATTTHYGTGWLSTDLLPCQITTTTGTVTMVSGAANFSTTPVITDIGYVDICTPWQQSTSYTNNGAGNSDAATMYNLKIRMGNYSSAGNWGVGGMGFVMSNFRVGATAVTAVGSNTTTYVLDFNNVFTTDPDGVGGLEDLDGDGFYDDLAPGTTLNITWDIATVCNTACGVQVRQHIGHVLEYEDMCDNHIVSIVRETGAKIAETNFGTNSYFPSNITNGGVYRFEFDYTNFGGISNVYAGGNSRYQYRLVLPAGLTVASPANAIYNGSAISYTMSGDTLIITSPNATIGKAGIDLTYTCGTSGNLNLWHSLVRIYDITSSCKCNVYNKYCATFSTYAQCPTPCPVGPTSYQPVVRRTDGCLGWTNHTLATRQVASNISAYDLKKALFLDTIQITGTAIQNSNATNLHLRFELPRTTLSPTNVNKLTPVNLIAEIWRAGVMINTCTLSSFANPSVTGMQKIDWNICLPVGGIQAGDSIFTISRYIVSTNAGLPQEDIQSGGTWYFYNSNGGTDDYCNQWVPEMYLVGTSSIIGSNGTNASECSSFIPGSGFAYIARRFNSFGKEYTKEFRPMVYIDSIVFIKTNGYDLVSTDLVKNAGPFGTPSVPKVLTPNYVIGNAHTYINDGSWPIFGVTKTNNYGGNFRPTVSTNCRTTTTETFQTKIYIRDYYYAFGTPSKVPATYQYVMSSSSNANVASGTGWNYSLNYVASTRPDITIQNMTGAVQTSSLGNNYWDVKISNNSIGNASYVWFALEKGTGSGTINITSVEDITNGGTLTSVGSYSCSGTTGYSWYKFSVSGLASGVNNVFRIHFNPNNCSQDSVLFKAGWNCSAYPTTNPCDYSCTPETTYLRVNPESAQIQLSILRQPGNGSKLDLCSEDYVTAQVKSTQGADLVDPYILFTPPVGMTVNTANIEVEYPLGSGNIQHPTISTLPGGILKIDLNGHSNITGNGILGVINASNDNETSASVKIPFTPYCDYVSGTSIALRGFGNKPCGTTALGNGISISTNAIKINGVPENGGVTSNFLTVAPIDLACDSVTTIEHNATTYGENSLLGDTLVYTLPSGVTYHGNFSSTPASTIVVADNLVKVVVPVNSTSIALQFDVKSDCNNCNSSALQASYQRDVEGLSCGGVSCAGTKNELAANAIAFNCYDPLPVTLIDFSAQTDECDMVIKWSTATERDCDYFEIYRSEDGISWEKIAETKGSGNSSTRIDYQITDNTISSGKIYYYTLKQYDFNGKSEQFNPISAVNKTCSGQDIKVYPNPVKDVITIELPYAFNENILVELVDATGKVVKSQTYNTKETIINENIKSLSSGVYQVKVSVEEVSFPVKKVVRL